MGSIYKNGILFAGSIDNAKSISFDNTNADIEATNVQDAIEEINSNVNKLNNYSAVSFSKSSIMSNGGCSVYKVGNVVTITGLFQVSSESGTLGTIPSGFRPPIQLNLQISQDSGNCYRAYIKSNGQITLENNLPINVWCFFTISYSIK